MVEALRYLWSIIELAIGGITNVVNIVNLCLACSVCTGKFIVDLLARFMTEIVTVSSAVIHGISIMYEDFLYFLSDLQNMLSFLESLFKLFYEFVFSLISFVYDTGMNLTYMFTYTLVTIKDGVCGIYRNGLKTIYDCLLTFKGALIIIGNVIWMSLTLIPGLFVYLISLFVFFINKCTEEVISIFKAILTTLCSICSETFNFIIDTPLESVCGLIVGAGLIYFVGKYRLIILDIASQNFCKTSKYLQEIFSKLLIFILCLLHASFHKCRHLLNEAKRVIHNYPERLFNGQNPIELPDVGTERLCVVCHDIETNIVIIPCKHMCLCEECSENPIFRPYGGSLCPVCRCEIAAILKVYR